MANKPTLKLKILTLFIQDSKLSQTLVMKLLKRNDHGNISEECRSLEKAGFLKVHHKELNGGRPEIFYRITNEGVRYLVQNSETPTEFWTSIVLLVYYENTSISWQKILELFELYLKKYLKHYLKEGYYSIQLDDFNSSCNSWFEKAILGRKISPAQKVLEVLAKNPDLSLGEISRVTQERVSTIESIIKMYTVIPHKPVLVDVYGHHDSPFYNTADWRFQIHNAISQSNSKGTFRLTIFGILMVLFIILKNHQGKLPHGLMKKDDVQSYFDKIASNYKSAIPLIFEKWQLLQSFLKEYSYLNFIQILDRQLREKSFDSSVLDGGTKELYIGMRETTLASRRQLIELQTAGMNVIFNFRGTPGANIDFEGVQKKIQPCFHLFLYLISIINPTNYDPETFISMYSNEKYLGNRLAKEIGSIYDISHLEKSLSFEISFIYYLTIRSTLFYDRFTLEYSKQLFTKIINSDGQIRKFIQERLARVQNYYKEVQRTMSDMITIC
jgi:DNA-binding PadR family transcriptional regulator